MNRKLFPVLLCHVRAEFFGALRVFWPHLIHDPGIIVMHARIYLLRDFYHRASFQDRLDLLPEQHEALSILDMAERQIPWGKGIPIE